MPGAGPSHSRAVLFKVLYVISIVVMLALIKGLEGVPVGEAMFFRCFFSILPIAAWLAWRGEMKGVFHTARPGAHVVRTLLGTAAMGLTFVAVQNLPLPEAITLQYSQPLFVVAFSALILGERVGVFRWGAVAFGFLGVLVVTCPGLTLLGAGTADLSRGEMVGISAALVASAGVAVVLLLVGNLVRTEKPETITLWFWMVSSSVLGLATVWAWGPLSAGQTAVLVLCGILGGMAQMFMAISLLAAPASSTAAFEYTSLIFATLIGFVVFGDLPGVNTVAGGLMVIAAGLLIIWRERRRGIDANRPPRVLPPE